MPKPLVDRLEGIAPSVAIEQRAPVMSSRSTVGTATEVYDHLRLLWARAGEQFCVRCGSRVRRDTPQSVTDSVLASGGRIQVAFPLPQVSRASRDAVIENLRALGFVRIALGESVHRLDELPRDITIDENTDIVVIVDRLTAEAASAGRIAEAVATAFQEGEGIALIIGEDGPRSRFTEFPACSNCDTPAPTITPALFSFNNPRGACPTCNGFGAVLEYDLSLIVPTPVAACVVARSTRGPSPAMKLSASW